MTQTPGTLKVKKEQRRVTFDVDSQPSKPPRPPTLAGQRAHIMEVVLPKDFKLSQTTWADTSDLPPSEVLERPIFSADIQQGGLNFGATTGGLFGASSGGLFGGAASSAPAFGNTAASFSLFGSQASQSTSLFGSTPAPQPSLFGASSSASAFSFGGGGGFGQTQPASSAASLFGSAPAFGGLGQPQSSSAFGAQTTSNVFGQPAQQNQIVPAGYTGGLSGQPDFSALRELEAIAAAYDPNSPKFRFNYLFLNVVDNPAARLKPVDVDEIQWRGAIHKAGGLDNPDRLWPVQAKGFKDLLARKEAQDQAIKEYADRLDAAERAAKQLARRQESLLKDRISAVQRKHLELSHKLLSICRHIDALEGRLAMAQDYWSPTAAETVNRLSSAMTQLEHSMNYQFSGGLQRKVSSLASAARLKEEAPIVQTEYPDIDENSLKQIFGIVSQQAAAIERLQDVLKRTNRDLAIMQKEESV